MANNIYIFDSSLGVNGGILAESSNRASNKFFATDGTILTVDNSLSLADVSITAAGVSKKLANGDVVVSEITDLTASGEVNLNGTTSIDSATIGDMVVTGSTSFTLPIISDLDVLGNVNLEGTTTADSLTVGNLSVTGNATFINEINGDLNGDASTVSGGHTVLTNVPANAKFTDTWRSVAANGTTFLTNNTSVLNVSAGESIKVAASGNTLIINASTATMIDGSNGIHGLVDSVDAATTLVEAEEVAAMGINTIRDSVGLDDNYMVLWNGKFDEDTTIVLAVKDLSSGILNLESEIQLLDDNNTFRPITVDGTLVLSETDTTPLSISSSDGIQLAWNNNNLEIAKAPLFKRTYSNVYASGTTQATSNMYFGQIIPTASDASLGKYYAQWSIKYRMHITFKPVNTSGNVDSTAANYSGGNFEVLVFGGSNTIQAYYVYNNHLSTNYRSIYYHTLYCINSAGVAAGYGHELGVGLRSSWGYYYNVLGARTIDFEILEMNNCTFNPYDTAKIASANNYGGTNYYSIVKELDAYNIGLRETGDDNTTTQLNFSGSYYQFERPQFKYLNIIGFTNNNKLDCISLYKSSASATPTINGGITQYRDYSTAGYDWQKGLYLLAHWNTTLTSFADNINLYSAYSCLDFRFSDNVVAETVANTLGLELYKFIYLRGIIKDDNLFYLRPYTVTYNSKPYQKAWTQNPEDETVIEDGVTYKYSYWLLGAPYYNASYTKAGYLVNLYENNYMYLYDNDGVFCIYNKVNTLTLNDSSNGLHGPADANDVYNVIKENERVTALAYGSIADSIGLMNGSLHSAEYILTFGEGTTIEQALVQIMNRLNNL